MSSLLDPLSIDRGSISAPAGCGKTHLIAKSIASHTDDKPILVLTHTNAGVAALKKRLDGFGVLPSMYRLSTIDGWAIRIISKFPLRSDYNPSILKLSKPKTDYPAIKSAALNLLCTGHIDDVIKASYSRLLVDEYQDCMQQQHSLVVALANLLPTCIFGDELQCIFGWSGTKPDWVSEVLHEFPSKGELDVPHRWNNVGCNDLGQWLLDIRPTLKNGGTIDLKNAPSEVTWVELDGSSDDARRLLQAARTKAPITRGSVLIICDGINKKRQQEVARHTPGAVVVENVDLTDFIDFAESFDFKSPSAGGQLIDFAASMMTGVDPAGLKDRLETIESGRSRTEPSEIELAAIAFSDDPSPRSANQFLVEANKLSGVRPHRPSILSACLRALDSCSNAEEFHEMAVSVREQQRVVGREIRGRAVGSTLLLKGLEADVAVLLDTDRFGAEDLYVALTRGARKIVVCSLSNVITIK